MNKETKNQIANALMEYANVRYSESFGPELRAVASFAYELAPLFNTRSNSTAYRHALQTLKYGARSIKELKAERKPN